MRSESEIKILKSIRNWIVIGSVGFLLIGVSALILSISVAQVSNYIDEEESTNVADNDIDWKYLAELYNKNELDGLIGEANKRLEEYPNDATVLWFLAKAYNLKGQANKSLEYLSKVEVHAPAWRSEYVQPLRESIQSNTE